MRERYARGAKDGPMPKYLRRLSEESSWYYSDESGRHKDPSRSERARRDLSHTAFHPTMIKGESSPYFKTLHLASAIYGTNLRLGAGETLGCFRFSILHPG